MRMFKTLILTGIISIGLFQAKSQSVPIPAWNPGDTLFPWGYEQVGTNWDTSPYLPFKLNSTAFRLMPPNGVTYQEETNTWQFEGTTKYPIILFFHGAGERGTDNNNQLKHGGKLHRNAVQSGEFPGFLLYPQNANAADMKEILDKLLEEGLPIDVTRVYVHGLSRGGGLTWDFLYSYPHLVAAAWPMSATKSANDYSDIIYTPIRLAQGGRDRKPKPEWAEQLVGDIKDVGGNIEYLLLPNAGHGTWNQMYNRSDFFTWFLSQKINKVYAKFAYYQVCPEDPIEVTLGVKPGHTNYEWRKDGVLLPEENGHELVVSSYGDYSARVNIDGVWTEWSEPLTVDERQPTETPPIELKTLDSYVLPDPNGDLFVKLTLPDGFEAYEWYKDGSSISTSQTIDAAPGVYTALVQEEFGCSSNFSEPFEVILTDPQGDLPDIPTDIQAQADSKTAMNVTWTDNASNETGIELYRRSSTTGSYKLIALLPPNSSSYHDTDLLPGKAYYYSLRAFNDDGASALSTETSGVTDTDTILPSVPQNLQVQATTDASVTITWDPSTDDVGLSRYNIYQDGVKVLTTDETFITLYNLNEGQVYRFNVSAVDLFENESPLSNRVIVAPVFSGLNYKYYEGAWSNLPDFNSLTPVDEGNIENVDISVRLQNNDFGFLWEGKINIPVAGSYTFETYSDDGSKLYINGQLGDNSNPYNESYLVVDNDGLHGSRYREGTVNFNEPGSYRIAITFFERGGGENMKVFWKNTAHGVGNRQLIPNSAFGDEMVIPEEDILAPTDFTATAISQSEIDLSWDYDQSEIDKVENFQIYRTKSNDLDFTPIALLEPDMYIFKDTNLESNTEYIYKIIALGAFSQSDKALSVPVALHIPFDYGTTDLSGNQIQSNSVGIITYDDSQKIQGAKSASFASNSSYINLDNGDEFIHDFFTERTVTFWLYTDDFSGIQDIYDEGGGTNGFAIRINNENIELGVRDGGNQADTSAPISIATWQHIAAVFDNGNIQIYVDGVLASELTNVGYSEINSHGDAAGLGATNGGNAFDVANNNFDGWVDDFFVFGQALSQADIAGLMDRTEEQTQASATTLPPPAADDPITNFRATILNQHQVQFNWNINENAFAYQVLRSEGDVNKFRLIGYLAPNMDTHIDSLMTPHTEYYYTIRSRTLTGYSPNSDTLHVAIPNAEPTFLTEIPDQSVFFEDLVEFTVQAQDADFDELTFSGINFPDFVTLSAQENNTATLAIDPDADDHGTYPNLTLRIDDGYGGVADSTFNLEVFRNYAPIIETLETYSMNGGESLSVTINASDPNGDNLSWTTENLPDFATADDQADSLILDFNPDLTNDGGVYYIDLTVQDDNALAPKTDQVQLQLTVVPLDPNHKIFVNFGGDDPVSTAGEPWNNFLMQPSQGQTIENLVTETGFTTPTTIELLTSWNNTGKEAGNPNGIYPDEVRESYFWTNDGPETVRVSGLNTNITYNFDLFASRDGEPDRTTTFAIDGQSISIQAAYNADQLAQFTGIQPQGTGNDGYVDISISKPGGSQFAYLNAMVIEAVSGSGLEPLAPTELAANIDGQVHLTWNDNAYNEDGFKVLRSTTPGGPFSEIATLPVDATTYSNMAMPAETTYYYQVSAFNAYGNTNSQEIEIYVPNLPPALTTTPENTIVIEAANSQALDYVAQDAPDETLSYTLNHAPAFVTLIDHNDRTATVNLQPQEEDFGTYEGIQVTVSDGNLTSSHVFDLTVEPVGAESYLINFTSGQIAPEPWNNFVTSKGNAATLEDINSTKGDISDIDIAIVDNWQNTNESGMSDGVFPSQVMETALWESDIDEKTLKISGLNTDNVYNIGFFTSRNEAGERTTEFTIGNKSVTQNASLNTDEIAYVSNVFPDQNGEISISARKLATSEYAYLNAITIDGQKYIPGIIEEDPIVLKAKGISEDDIQLTWVESIRDEQEFEIWRSTSPDDASFTRLTTVPANTTTYTDFDVTQNQVYYYKVRGAYDADSFTDYSNIANSSGILFTVFVNFNAQDPAAAPWNNLSTVPAQGVEIVSSEFSNTQGQNTGISLTIPAHSDVYDNYGFNGENPFGMNTGNNSGVVPDNVMRSTYWMDVNMTAEVVFEGFNLTNKFSFEFFASRDGGGDRNTEYAIGDQSVVLNASYNTSETVIIDDVIPDDNGKVNVRVSATPNASFGYLGGIMIYGFVNGDASGARLASNNANAGLMEESEETTEEIERIYPNPFTDQFTISTRLKEGVVVEHIRVMDMQGRSMNVKTFDSSTVDGNIRISGGHLQPGLYILELTKSDGQSIIKRLLKR